MTRYLAAFFVAAVAAAAPQFLDVNVTTDGAAVTVTYGDRTVVAPMTGQHAIPMFSAPDDDAPLCEVTHEIEVVPGGFDVVVDLRNPGAEPRRRPNVNIAGIVLATDVDVERDETGKTTAYVDRGFHWLDSRNLGTVGRRFTHWSTWRMQYPEDLYSPVLAAWDDEVAIGVSLLYDPFTVKHNVRGQYMMRGRTLVMGFDLHAPRDGVEDIAVLLPPGGEASYRFVVRFAKPDPDRKPHPGWLDTLEPYREFFRARYGGVRYPADRRPVMGQPVAQTQFLDAETNPRGYHAGFDGKRVDLAGWGPYAAWLGERVDEGYRRVMVWVPSGLYLKGDNFPPEFMTEWPPKLVETLPELLALKQRGVKLGMWWGRSNQVSGGWNTGKMWRRDPTNERDRQAAFAELDLAVQRGVDEVGLDAWPAIPLWQRYGWLQELRTRYPTLNFITEPSESDVVHTLAATFEPFSRQGQAPVLADWLLPGHESWIMLRYQDVDPVSFNRIVGWGCVPVTLSRSVGHDATDLLPPVPAPVDLEVNAAAGTWLDKGGIRGGGLAVDKLVQVRDLPAICDRPAGSCTFLMRPDVAAAAAPGGVVLAGGNMELVKTRDSTWLELRRGHRAVRKMIYDLPAGKWVHVALVWDDERLALYVNGKPAEPVAGGDRVRRRAGLFLGAGLGRTTFDEIATFLEPLPADEVAERAEIALSGKISRRNPTLAVPRAAAAPAVDGVLAPGEWDHAAGFANFAKHFSSRYPAANRNTHAWMTWDDTNFYMAFRIPVTRPHDPEAKALDKIRFGDRTVELFFQPNPSGELEYFQLAFDSAGTRYDSRITDAKYDAPWTVKSTVDLEWWTAEIAIPYASINALPAAVGDRWKMNVVCTSGQWSPSGAFHEAGKFGLLKFVASASPGLCLGAVARQDGKLVVPWRLAGAGDLTIRATLYPTKGIVPLSAARAAASAAQPAGDLTLDLGGADAGMLEVTAFTDPHDALYQHYIAIDADYLGAVTFLKDLPEDVRNPPKPTAKKDATAAERKAAEAADWRPTTDEIEAAIVEQQQWLGNDIGAAPAVPAPWTPMALDGRTVRCWAKAFDLTGTVGLPAQVEVLDAPLFAAAPALTVGGKPLASPTLLVKRRQPDRIETVGGGTVGDVNVTLEARYEFDGFARYDLTLTPMADNAVVDGLRLTFPFAREHAEYFHIWGGNAYGRATNQTANLVPAAGLTTGFEANVWIGDDARGYCWFAEAPKGWSHPDAPDLIRIRPNGQRTDLTIDIMRAGTPLPAPVTITFGTMATPAKPRPPAWRTWEGKLTMDWTWYSVFSFPYPARDPDAFRKKNQNPFHIPMISNFFAGTVYIEDGRPVPEQWLWGHLWNGRWDGPREPYGQARGTPGKVIQYVSQAMGTSWPDFYLYKLRWMRQEYGLRSVYLDTCIRDVTNPFGDYTWTAPDGSTRGAVDIFAFRDFQKRLYNFVHEDPEGLIVMHHSNQVAIPILSFADAHMNGEHFNTGPHQVTGRHYSDPAVMPSAAARAAFSLRQWGAVPTFLPEHPKSTRAMMGWLWAHDMLIYNAWCDFPVLRAGQDARQTFGLGDATFLAYWEATPPTKPNPTDVYASAWRQPDAVLLLVANMTARDQSLRLELLPANLGFTPVTATDVEHGQTFPVEDNVLLLPVKEHDFRMLKLEGGGE